MKKQDGRRLRHEALDQTRITAMQRVQAGERPEVVIKSIGFQRNCIYQWLSEYRFGGIDALRAKKLDGRPAILSGEQLVNLYTVVPIEDPRQYQFPFALWAVGIVRQVMAAVFGVRISAVSVWRTLKYLGLTPQRPLRSRGLLGSQIARIFARQPTPRSRDLVAAKGYLSPRREGSLMRF